VDELEGGTGHDPHRGPRHSFDGVHVDELEGGTGHDPHRGPRHSFDGVHVDELEGGTGHAPHHEQLAAGLDARHATAAAPEQAAAASGRKSRRKSAAPERATAGGGDVAAAGAERPAAKKARTSGGADVAGGMKAVKEGAAMEADHVERDLEGSGEGEEGLEVRLWALPGHKVTKPCLPLNCTVSGAWWTVQVTESDFRFFRFCCIDCVPTALPSY
jgi:hypothetical protein